MRTAVPLKRFATVGNLGHHCTAGTCETQHCGSGHGLSKILEQPPASLALSCGAPVLGALAEDWAIGERQHTGQHANPIYICRSKSYLYWWCLVHLHSNGERQEVMPHNLQPVRLCCSVGAPAHSHAACQAIPTLRVRRHAGQSRRPRCSILLQSTSTRLSP